MEHRGRVRLESEVAHLITAHACTGLRFVGTRVLVRHGAVDDLRALGYVLALFDEIRLLLVDSRELLLGRLLEVFGEVLEFGPCRRDSTWCPSRLRDQSEDLGVGHRECFAGGVELHRHVDDDLLHAGIGTHGVGRRPYRCTTVT